MNGDRCQALGGVFLFCFVLFLLFKKSLQRDCMHPQKPELLVISVCLFLEGP